MCFGEEEEEEEGRVVVNAGFGAVAAIFEFQQLDKGGSINYPMQQALNPKHALYSSFSILPFFLSRGPVCNWSFGILMGLI